MIVLLGIIEALITFFSMGSEKIYDITEVDTTGCSTLLRSECLKYPSFEAFSLENILKTTPEGIASRKENKRTLIKKYCYKIRTSEELKHREVEIPGKLLLEGTKLYFFPLFVHHMADEEWDLIGPGIEEIKKRIKPNVVVCAKLQGTRIWRDCRVPSFKERGEDASQLLSYCEGYGAMGYHYRRYDFHVKKIVWIITWDKYYTKMREASTICQEVEKAIKKEDFSLAIQLCQKYLELNKYLGSKDEENYCCRKKTIYSLRTVIEVKKNLAKVKKEALPTQYFNFFKTIYLDTDEDRMVFDGRIIDKIRAFCIEGIFKTSIDLASVSDTWIGYQIVNDLGKEALRKDMGRKKVIDYLTKIATNTKDKDLLTYAQSTLESIRKIKKD